MYREIQRCLGAPILKSSKIIGMRSRLLIIICPYTLIVTSCECYVLHYDHIIKIEKNMLFFFSPTGERKFKIRIESLRKKVKKEEEKEKRLRSWSINGDLPR